MTVSLVDPLQPFIMRFVQSGGSNPIFGGDDLMKKPHEIGFKHSVEFDSKKSDFQTYDSDRQIRFHIHVSSYHWKIPETTWIVERVSFFCFFFFNVKTLPLCCLFLNTHYIKHKGQNQHFFLWSLANYLTVLHYLASAIHVVTIATNCNTCYTRLTSGLHPD